MGNLKKNTIAGQWDEYISPLLDSLRVPQKGEPGYYDVAKEVSSEYLKPSKSPVLANPNMDMVTQDKLFAGVTSPLKSEPSQPEINPVVKEYLAKKMQPIKSPASEAPSTAGSDFLPIAKKPGYMDKFNDDAYEKVKADSESRQEGLSGLQFLAGFGDALAQRSPSESAKNFDKIRTNIKDETIGQFQRDKNQAVDDFKNKQMMDNYSPDSQQSIAFRKMIEAKFPDVAKSYGKMWDQVSAADKENIFEPLKLKENIEARKDAMRIAAMGRQDALNSKLADKADKKKQAMNEVEDRRQNINSNIFKLKQMIDEDGTWEMMGSHNQDMDRLVEQIATDMAKLMDPNSVARPQEVESIKKTLVRPGFANTNSTAQDILSHFENEINSRANTAYRIRGLDAPQGRPQATENGQSGFPRKVRKGNQIATVSNQQELDEATQEGFQ